MRNVSRLGRLNVAAFAVGAVLFAGTLIYLDVRTLQAAARQLGTALPLVLLASGLWHVLRTVAWAVSFPRARPAFARLLRVRLAAEAFSYVTIRGVGGEPLKILLLAHQHSASDATAAVALERIAYIVVTLALVASGAAIALGTTALTEVWFRIFRALLIATGVIVLLTACVVLGRGSYARRALEAVDRLTGRRSVDSTAGRFVVDVERVLLELVRGDRGRLVALVLLEAGCFLLMTLEVWVVGAVMDAPLPLRAAVAVETFSRAASMISAFIPANLGALEASNVAAVTAVGAGAAAGAVAVARRIRGLCWAAVGFAIYPRHVSRAPTGPIASRTPVL
jgi:uncharacterized membrane protein YbhN (UPF0104 family)